ATLQAREFVANVSESTATMHLRFEAMEHELGGLIESLKTGSNRLNADLQLLVGNLDEVKDAVGPRPRFEPEPASQTYAAAPLEESEPEYAAEGAYAQSEPHEGEGG